MSPSALVHPVYREAHLCQVYQKFPAVQRDLELRQVPLPLFHRGFQLDRVVLGCPKEIFAFLGTETLKWSKQLKY